MRRPLAVGCALLALAACKSEKLRTTETELAAARARVATLDQKRADVVKELARLQLERRTLAQQADEADLARQRLLAAAGALQGQPIPDGVLLDEALRGKSPELGKLAATIVQRQLPCVDERADEEERDGPDCEPPPLPDACEGVPERTVRELSWTCGAVVKAAGAPPTAVCTSPLDDEALVRLAFEHQGRLYVADWPTPSVDLYRPANSAELDACQAENDHEGCLRACDDKHGRTYSGCDNEQGEYDDGSYEEGEDEENPELRQARIDAANAEAEADRARDELAYQQCRASCEPPEEAETTEDPGPEPREVRFLKAPAPGLFHFSVGGQPDAGMAPREWVLSFLALNTATDGRLEAEEDDTVDDLQQVLNVDKLLVGAPLNGLVVLAGVQDGKPTGVRAHVDGKDVPVTMSVTEVCDFAASKKDKALLNACAAAMPDAGGAP